MRKMLAVAVVLCLAAMPAMAAVGNVSPVSTSTLPVSKYNAQTGQLTPTTLGSRAGGTIYQDFTQSGYFLGQGLTASYTPAVGDDIHATAAGTMTSFTFAYVLPSATASGFPNSGSAVTINFHANTAADGLVPPFPATPGFFSINVTGLPTGTHAIAVTGLSVPVGTDFWIEQDWAANGVLRGGPILSTSGGTIGYSHSIFSQTGSTWTLPIWADFFLAVNIVPEPASIGLLAFGGLVVLRRRR
ncbi:MAG: PEP-CTERM sorting domain-containing protein [Phycisphaerales bacterium]|nr:PEP-CTERM sorting domain-containing protein [Phycisphaerales bacterium]